MTSHDLKLSESPAELPIACDLTAIYPEKRDHHQQLWRQIQSSVQAMRELPDGYALHLPNDAATILATAEFITLERLCCPFFNFKLEITPASGPVWLHLTGDEGVKDFLSTLPGELEISGS